MASLVAQMVKRLPTMWETRVRSLGWEYPLEKEMATHSVMLAWRIPRTEESGELQSMRRKRDLFHHVFLFHGLDSTVWNILAGDNRGKVEIENHLLLFSW